MEIRWRVREAARCVSEGGVIAYPTEAVYGLGCDPRNAAAVCRLLEIKHRPVERGLILIGADFRHIAPFLGRPPRKLLDRARKSWPGPHTWLLPAGIDTPSWIRGMHDTIAVRVTAHPVAAALCMAIGGALVSTSANVHKGPPARSALQVRLRFGTAVDLVLGGATGPERHPTEIRDAASGRVVRAA